MSNENKNWVVDVETIAPFGLCETDPPQYNRGRGKQYATVTGDFGTFTQEFQFEWHRGTGQQRDPLTGQLYPTYAFNYCYQNSAEEFIRRTYNLPDDTYVGTREIEALNSLDVRTNNAQEYFETEAEALEYVCLLYTSPSPRDRQKSRMPSSA